MADLLMFKRTTLTGGGATAVDGISATALVGGELCFVAISEKGYTYEMSASSGATADGVNIIIPVVGTVGNKRWILQKTPQIVITKASTGTLTIADVIGTVISNYAQAAANTQTLPAAAAGYRSMVSISTAGAGAFHLKAGASDKIYLNGTALDDGDKVTLATPAIGDCFSFFTIQTGASTYDWVVVSGIGLLIDGGA